MTKRTKHDLTVCIGWTNKPVTIPAGSAVIPANNITEGGFWLHDVPADWSDDDKSWADIYGIHVSPEDVAE